jgi:adenylate kinase family enzyme
VACAGSVASRPGRERTSGSSANRRTASRPAVRIHVTGNAGAGKTTLARKLGAKLSIPVTHLDQIVWAPDWREVPAQEREAALSRITGSDSWIIEGVSRSVRERADLVVFLDVPRVVCLWRCIHRTARYLRRPRPELPAQCPEWRIWPRLPGMIWRFADLVGNRILQEANASPRYVVLRGTESADEWLRGFCAETGIDRWAS